MGHFTIRLPEDKNGTARRRKVYKNHFYSFRNKKLQLVTSYLIYFNNSNNEIEFHLFKSDDGEWSADPHGKVTLDNEILIYVKEAIIKKEKIKNEY